MDYPTNSPKVEVPSRGRLHRFSERIQLGDTLVPSRPICYSCVILGGSLLLHIQMKYSGYKIVLYITE